MKPSTHCRAGAVPLLIVASLMLFATSSASAQTRRRVRLAHGCWQASRPLGPTGGALSVPRDAPFTTIVLRDSGRVVLPMLNDRERPMWEGRSYWEMSGDSVALIVFTGLQGWRSQLSAQALPRSMQGRATYLTDVIVAKAEPLTVGVTLTRITCQDEWADVPITTRLPRRWERGEAVYYEFQVERPAALAAGTKLPEGVLSMRSLGRNEKSDASADRPEIVVAQFIVESTGRVDTSALKLLDDHGERSDKKLQRAIANLLISVRFTPPMIGGKEVHQLAQWRIERSRN